MYKDVLKNYFIKLSLHFSTSNELFLLKSLLGRVMYRTASDPKTANWMIPKMDRKWSPLSTAGDPAKSRGMEWVLGMNGECAENLNNA